MAKRGISDIAAFGGFDTADAQAPVQQPLPPRQKPPHIPTITSRSRARTRATGAEVSKLVQARPVDPLRQRARDLERQLKLEESTQNAIGKRVAEGMVTPRFTGEEAAKTDQVQQREAEAAFTRGELSSAVLQNPRARAALDATKARVRSEEHARVRSEQQEKTTYIDGQMGIIDRLNPDQLRKHISNLETAIRTTRDGTTALVEASLKTQETSGTKGLEAARNRSHVRIETLTDRMMQDERFEAQVIKFTTSIPAGAPLQGGATISEDQAVALKAMSNLVVAAGNARGSNVLLPTNKFDQQALAQAVAARAAANAVKAVVKDAETRPGAAAQRATETEHLTEAHAQQTLDVVLAVNALAILPEVIPQAVTQNIAQDAGMSLADNFGRMSLTPSS